jgi:hypothetical protein
MEMLVGSHVQHLRDGRPVNDMACRLALDLA